MKAKITDMDSAHDECNACCGRRQEISSQMLDAASRANMFAARPRSLWINGSPQHGPRHSPAPRARPLVSRVSCQQNAISSCCRLNRWQSPIKTSTDSLRLKKEQLRASRIFVKAAANGTADQVRRCALRKHRNRCQRSFAVINDDPAGT